MVDLAWFGVSNGYDHHWLLLKCYSYSLKGYFTSGKINVYLKWVIYVEEM